ncbi:MAG TPA: enoyl-CoA hydratase/isomerase family protein [Polyangia bacterium]|nr:enoyl-CoA hydratase/isomerase family protein [Polyangia bacterium]
MSGTIEIERREAIAIVTLMNERKKNALDPTMLDALCAAMARFPGEGVRAVVLTGAGDVFSSGYDISALPSGAAPSANPLGPALAAISDGPLPVVAALNGAAIGGGCELAATCDLRVAHDAVTLMMPPVRLGLVYAPTGLARFVALCGLSRTRELFLTAQPVPAPRAREWGLVDRVVARDEVLPTALAIAEEMARGAPLAVAGTRRALERMMPRVDGAAAMELAQLMQAAWTSEDAAEARAAWSGKRKPEFKGR